MQHQGQRLIVRRYLSGLLAGAILMSGHGAAYHQIPTAQQMPASALRTPAGSAAQPKTPPGQAQSWIVGATPLPRRKDGYGVVRSTPPALVDRRFPTADRLPPPTSNTFQSAIAPVSPEVLARSSWKPTCPAKPEQLRYLTMSFRGFDARAHTGEMLVNASVAQAVIDVFRKLFNAGFPLEQMHISPEAELNLPPEPVAGTGFRIGHRHQPVPEPVRQRRPGGARAGVVLPQSRPGALGHDRGRRPGGAGIRGSEVEMGRALARTGELRPFQRRWALTQH
jgi:hypothetical protein